MLPQLTKIPTSALVELLAVIITGETCTANDLAEIHQIRSELRRRGEWNLLEFANAG